MISRRHTSSSNNNRRILAPINLATDLVENRTIRLGAVLRMADHHLNLRSQGLIPYAGVEPFCVSQACRNFGLDEFKQQLEQQVSQCQVQHGESSSIASFVPLVSEIWVQALGTSSISFGHAVSFRDHIVGLATRVFVRLDTSTGKLLKVSQEERTGVLEAMPHLHLTLPEVEKLDITTGSEQDRMQEVFQVKIGPQHCNNIHVDHAALADLVLQGLSIRKYSLTEQQLSMQYVNPGTIGKTVSCKVHSDKPLAAIYQQDDTDKSKQNLLALGQLSN